MCVVFSLAQSVKIMIAVAIFLTYALQFYVPFEIIWRRVKPHCKNNERVVEYGLRIVLVILTGEQNRFKYSPYFFFNLIFAITIFTHY